MGGRGVGILGQAGVGECRPRLGVRRVLGRHAVHASAGLIGLWLIAYAGRLPVSQFR